MNVHDIVGAILDVEEAVRLVPPVGNVPHLGLGAVRRPHARLRLGVVDLVRDIARAQLFEDARPAAAQRVPAGGPILDGLELPVVVDGAPDGDAVVVLDLERAGEVGLVVVVDSGLGDVVPDVGVERHGVVLGHGERVKEDCGEGFEDETMTD